MFNSQQLRRGSLAFASSLVAVAGCALTAPVPGGRLRAGAYTQFQPTWAISYSPAQATVVSTGSGDSYQVKANTDEPGLGVVTAPLPISIGVRQALGPHLEVGITAGFSNSGLELRFGPADEGQRIPWVVSVGARTGKVALADSPAYEGRLRFEAYLPVPEQSGAVHVVVYGGSSVGLFARVFPLPGMEPSGDVILSIPSVHTVRPEGRLEMGLGVHGRTPSFAYVVAIAPWLLMANGQARSLDGAYAVQELQSSAGVALVLGLFLGSGHAPGGPSAFQR